MYLKEKSHNVSGSASLQTPWISLPLSQHLSRRHHVNNGACMRFWFYMRGGNTNTLNVYIETTTHYAGQNGDLRSLMWKRKGDLGSEWHHAQIHVNSTPQFKVVITFPIHHNYQSSSPIFIPHHLHLFKVHSMKFDDYIFATTLLIAEL